jgi:hypothetical protein
MLSAFQYKPALHYTAHSFPTSNDFKPPCHFISRYSREFYSFKKSEVKAKFWFEDVDAKIRYETDKPQSKQ